MNFDHMEGIPVLFWICHPLFFLFSVWCGLRGYHKMTETPIEWVQETPDMGNFMCETCGVSASLKKERSGEKPTRHRSKDTGQ